MHVSECYYIICHMLHEYFILFIFINMVTTFPTWNMEFSGHPTWKYRYNISWRKDSTKISNEKYEKIPYFMWENLWSCFDMWNKYFLISCQNICLQIFITLPCTTSWTQLSDFTFTFHFHALEKEMATHSSVLAWRIPGMREPDGLPSTGLHRVRLDWSDLAAAKIDW